MKADERRSHRLNELLKMALRGKSMEEIEQRILQWGVTQETKRSYMFALRAQLQRMKEID